MRPSVILTKFGLAPAVVSAGEIVTFADLSARVRKRAKALKGRSWTAFVAKDDVDAIVEVWAHLEAGVPLALLQPRWTDVERRAVRARLERTGVPPDIALVVFTSGTSGVPKGVLLTQDALRSSAEASARRIGWHDGDRWLLSLSMAHIGGVSIVLRCGWAGASVVLRPQGRFEPSKFLDHVEEHDVTLLSVVPTMLDGLVKHRTPSNVRVVLVGGARTPPALARRAREAGWPVRMTYGLTEACSQVATQVAHDGLRGVGGVGGVGPVLDGFEAKVIDGRLHIRGPATFAGYLGSARRKLPDWFDTSDAATIDDSGGLHVLGRVDETINTGGENVHPLEVEDALRSLPFIRDAVVFGHTDAKWGQIVAAAVVGSPEFSRGAVMRRLRGHLAGFKIPRLMSRHRAFPCSPSGKVDRAAVRKIAREGLSPLEPRGSLA